MVKLQWNWMWTLLYRIVFSLCSVSYPHPEPVLQRSCWLFESCSCTWQDTKFVSDLLYVVVTTGRYCTITSSSLPDTDRIRIWYWRIWSWQPDPIGRSEEDPDPIVHETNWCPIAAGPSQTIQPDLDFMIRTCEYTDEDEVKAISCILWKLNFFFIYKPNMERLLQFLFSPQGGSGAGRVGQREGAHN